MNSKKSEAPFEWFVAISKKSTHLSAANKSRLQAYVTTNRSRLDPADNSLPLSVTSSQGLGTTTKESKLIIKAPDTPPNRRFSVPLEALSAEMQQVDNHEMLFEFDGFDSPDGLRLTVSKLPPPESRPAKRAKVEHEQAVAKVEGERASTNVQREQFAAEVESGRAAAKVQREQFAAKMESARAAAKVQREQFAAEVERGRAAAKVQREQFAAEVERGRAAAKVQREQHAAKAESERAAAKAASERADKVEHERAAIDTLVQIVKWAAAPSDMRLRLLEWVRAKPDVPPAICAWVGLLDAFCTADGGAGEPDAGPAGNAGRAARALEALAAHDRAVVEGQGDAVCAARANLGQCIDKAQGELPEGAAVRMRRLVVLAATADVVAWSGLVRPSMEAFHLALQLPWVPRR